MKRKFVIRLIGFLTIITLLFTGCSKGGNNFGDNTGSNAQKSTNTLVTENTSVKDDNSSDESSLSTNNISTVNKNARNITDSDLLNSDKSDSTSQLDSLYIQSEQLTQDEIDSLLNDNSDLNSIPSHFSVK
ncbi:hypothetical protein CLHOM_30110 [Clostridium homopropionicum DSM 5847]|uniref:Lipoprotein n=1 Tax=Clostridium homopropionicum DSM 5847 TaxID=1121318 RepID=A0A0L6Z6Z1_9CLOT|nr:hypothetical protein [Clostridium homopropionicum]KOA18727.1 hypothetical protein CLHOM_30110 [Clostridium homopropionicum DSM 5847]SFG54043.1 hypothetical protein SAMN04488501_110148 [Clostridium homopropionicum]